MESAQVDAALQKLLAQHGHKISEIDDIVLSYVCSILDDLSGEEDLFDAEAFAETLSAYLPEAENVKEEELKEWVFNLADEMARRELAAKRESAGIDLKRVIEATTLAKPVVVKTVKTVKPVASEDTKPQGKRVNRLSETSDGGSEGSCDGEDWCQMVDPLLEMFPYSCSLEVNHCLQLMAGDVEGTAQLIMHRHETGQALKPTDRKLLARIPKVTTNEKDVKKNILGKYGYVDKEEDQRYHRPMVKKNDDKKLIRYRDGKIVSTKGERFTQVSKQESEEMKKTIVNMQQPIH